MRIAHTVVVLLLGFGAGCDVNAPDQGAVTKQTDPLNCTIRGKRTCVLGKVPDITVAITNQTNADICLVGSLDASDIKWRYPFCYFEVIGPDGKSAVQEVGRCGNMSELREKDFVKVPPGRTFDPYKEVDEYGFFPNCQQINQGTFRMVGEYRIRFVYSSQIENIGAWVGDVTDARLLSLFRQVPKVEIRSNEIKVTIVERGK